MELEEIACVLLLHRRRVARQRRKRQWWVHPILKDKSTNGAFVTLYLKLRDHEPKFFNYFRMSIQSFDELLLHIKDEISPSDYVVRDGISSEEKLVITLR